MHRGPPAREPRDPRGPIPPADARGGPPIQDSSRGPPNFPDQRREAPPTSAQAPQIPAGSLYSSYIVV